LAAIVPGSSERAYSQGMSLTAIDALSDATDSLPTARKSN